MRRNNFILGIALMIGVVLGGLCPAHAVSVPYLNASGKSATASNATEMTTSSTALTAGWYVVNSNTTISDRIIISGEVNLILADGYKLTATKGINVSSDYILNIYGQSGGTGTLTINGVDENYAGIGSGYKGANGTVTINGGTVTANGGKYSAGIGGGYVGAGGIITINGGTVTAKGGSTSGTIGGAGIGGGAQGAGGTITLNGGTVNATGGNQAAGIGGGDLGAGGNITINGGTIKASGNNGGAGIGGGCYGNGGTITINSGIVTATCGGDNAAGIGGGNGNWGQGGAGGTVTINGGIVTATGGSNGAEGIGHGYYSTNSGTLSIDSGLVLQTSTNNKDWTTTTETDTRTRYMKAGVEASYLDASGAQKTTLVIVLNSNSTKLSAGWYVVSSDTTINNRIGITGAVNIILADGYTLTAPKGITTTGATLNIYGQTNGTGTLTIDGVDDNYAGIGGSNGGAGGTVNIYRGTVNAAGGSNGAGIGGGNGGAGGTININGGTVIAAGGSENVSGIGGGDSGGAGTLKLGSGIVLQTSTNNSTWTDATSSSRARYMKTGTGASYVDASGTQQTAIVTVLTTSSTTLNNGNWYVVSGDTTISSRIGITGAVNIILGDGYTLTAPKGITTTGATLNIYGQTNGTGALTIDGVDDNYAGIGGGNNAAGGTVAIYGGNINVMGGTNGAGIGGGSNGSGGTVTINGGIVTATGNGASGIGGGGSSSSNGTITIHGQITAGTNASSASVVKTYNGEQYVKVDTTHEHSFTYTASGDTIIATCSVKDGCYLDNNTTTLTICAPAKGGGAAVLSGDTYYFGDVSVSDIMYSQKSGGSWGTATSSVPSGEGFFRASITVGDVTASVTYGVSAITVNPTSNGTVTAPAVATVSASVTLTVTPDTGYQLNTITASTDAGKSITITNNTFTMPEENVTVNATFSQIDYAITKNITSGSITIPDTAHYQDTVRLIVSPDAGYGIVSINVSDGTLTFVSRDLSTGVEVYELTMPAGEVIINVALEQLTVYTIFYKATSGVTSALYRFNTDDTEGYEMQADARLNNIACLAGSMSGAKGRTSFPISFKVGDGNWGAFVDCNVVSDISSFSSMTDGEAILVEGDDNAFIAAFVWGDFIVSEDLGGGTYDEGERKYYFVSKNTTSITVDKPSKSNYDFIGWSYADMNGEAKTIEAGNNDTIISIKDNIDKTTLFYGVWQPIKLTVTYDLDGGTWNGNSSETVSYGGTLTQPENPARSGYAFVNWTVKSNVTEQVNDDEILLAAGSAFDFANTKIIEDLKLKAVWKHVHAYAYIQLSEVNDIIPDYLTQEEIDQYEAYVHFKLCSKIDDYEFEAHKFGQDGKCICGFKKPDENVTLEMTLKNRDSTTPSTTKLKKNTAIAILAPAIGTDKFVKWEYRMQDSTSWKDLAAYPAVAFAIPGSMRANGVYESLSAPKLTLQADKYKTDGLIFYLQYLLPTGYTAKNAVIVCGNNHMLRYMYVNRPEVAGADISVFGIPVASVGSMEGEVVYKDREDNAMTAVGKAVLEYKMLTGQAVNISGYNDAYVAKAQRLGQTNGLAYAAFTGVSSKPDRYYYVLGWVDYVDGSGNAKTQVIGPIAVTYNGIVNNGTVTETN